MAKGKRLDLVLQECGLVESRPLAQTAIMDGCVLVDGVKVTKPGALIKEGAKVELTGRWQPKRYVSRGGLKLEKALFEFGLSVENKICLDIGASTGGFTDCLLQKGAVRIFAIDVGYGQLDWSLRTNDKIVVKERINARSMNRADIYGEDQNGPFATLAVIDLSFISIAKILPACLNCLADDDAQIIALIKPQFEAGPELVGKGGIVRSAQTHYSVIESVLSAGHKLGLTAKQLTYSPVKGREGNIEFLVLWQRASQPEIFESMTIRAVVDAAHAELDGSN